jgi:ferredoxin-type protein NapH
MSEKLSPPRATAFALLEKPPFDRRVLKVILGTLIFVAVGIVLRINLQIEGFWFPIFVGGFSFGVLHYLIAKIFGPAAFGRLFCSLTCWTAMVLDFLPFRRSPGRIPRWGRFRYVHFGVSLGLAAVLFGVFRYDPLTQPNPGLAELHWFLIGNAIYFAVAIGLAFRLKDNRAFCKYVCPITFFLKVNCRFSLVKISGKIDSCTACGKCDRACPMDIKVSRYILEGKRVLSTECILCSACVASCPSGALYWSFQRDVGGKEEYLREMVQGLSPRAK